jgi:trk system potassium uptake protein TrkH
MRLKRFSKVTKTVGSLCLLFTALFIPPMIISLIYHDGALIRFSESSIITFVLGIFLWFPFRAKRVEFYRSDGFLIIVLVWMVLSLLASIPFDLILHTSVIDSLFEAVSGVTTTGATVLSGLDDMPPSLLFYRQELQWFGGMGLIVLAIAVIPQLGIGGMSIYKAEVPGVMKEEKLTPRLSQTASLLWRMYLGLTISCASAYWMAGMSVYDAVSHSLATVSTGGFSTHDQSLRYFHSSLIEGIATVFMLLGAINFSLHFTALKERSLKNYVEDAEVRLFVGIIAGAVLLVFLTLEFFAPMDSLLTMLLDSVFTVVSMITSTGFVTVDYSAWPLFIPFFLILIGFVGGCGGSTAGGMKAMRVLILFKLVGREIKRLLHPQGVFLIRLNGANQIPHRTLHSVFGFFSLYVASFTVLLLLMMVDGVDQVTAFSAIATCMNNMGPGLGGVTQSFLGLDDPAKIISVASMLLGRLEVVSILVLLNPEYWRL